MDLKDAKVSINFMSSFKFATNIFEFVKKVSDAGEIKLDGYNRLLPGEVSNNGHTLKVPCMSSTLSNHTISGLGDHGQQGSHLQAVLLPFRSFCRNKPTTFQKLLKKNPFQFALGGSSTVQPFISGGRLQVGER